MSLIVVGSGPGIGLSTAKQLALKHFNKVALISRNAQRLSEEKTAVLDATKQTGKELTVEAFPTDICDLNALRKTFEQIEAMGPVGCVFFNAARIQPSELLKTSVEEIEEDFKTTNLGLYVTAQWAIPQLKQSGAASPSLFVTNSMLPEDPLPFLMSLSLVKASQQNMTQSLNKVFGKDIHIAIVKVGGQVDPKNPKMNPDLIAGKILELYEQKKENWTDHIDILE